MMRKLIQIITLFTASFTGALVYSQSTSAATFDSSYIISDSIFTNSTSMSANSIQNFINQKGSNCVNGEAPCLKNYIENNKSAGTIIAEAAQKYSINPQVILVTLQKENGLLTSTKPTIQRYKTAMGYACPDSTPGVCDSRYLGFSNQIDRAASMFNRIMTYDPTWYSPYQIGVNYVQYHPNKGCGGTNVNIKNRATAALYDYTPYQPNAASLAAGYGEGDSCSAYGNRNFWQYFNNWFGSSISSILIQSPQSQAVYLQNGNTRLGIPSWDVIDAYGFGRFGVTAVSDTYMNSLQDGGTLSTVFSNKAFPGPIYLADNSYRFGFSSYQQCVDWGFPLCTNSNFAKPLEPFVFDSLNIYGDMSPLMLNGTHISLMKNGEKQSFLSEQARIENGYGSIKYTPITNKLNTAQPFTYSVPQNNSFFSVKGNGTIYAYANKKFYPLTNSAYKGLLSKDTPVLYDDFSKFIQGIPAVTTTVGANIAFSDGTSFILTAEKKYDSSLVKADWPSSNVLDDIRVIANKRVVDAVLASSTTYRTRSGNIFMVQDKTARSFYSLNDYFSLGYKDPIEVDDGLLNDFQNGAPILSNGYGTLYQTFEPGKENLIFTPSGDGSTCQIYSLAQLGTFGLNSANTQRINKTSSSVNLLSTTTYDEKDNVHLIYNNQHSSISADAISNVWGIKNRMNICSFQSKFLEQKSITMPPPKFVRNEHTGIIYFGGNGFKRPIYSYSAFLKMGGNSVNTQDVSMEFLVSAPDGTPIYK
jgi:hypothetical protein